MFRESIAAYDAFIPFDVTTDPMIVLATLRVGVRFSNLCRHLRFVDDLINDQLPRLVTTFTAPRLGSPTPSCRISKDERRDAANLIAFAAICSGINVRNIILLQGRGELHVILDTSQIY